MGELRDSMRAVSQMPDSMNLKKDRAVSLINEESAHSQTTANVGRHPACPLASLKE